MKRLIEWFAGNHVAANLLMFLIVGAGLLTIPAIKQEIFPEFSLDMISVTVPYLGAAPEEVEEGVCVRVEEEIQDLEGIKQITSTSVEGVGTIMVELEPGTDTRKMLDDVKARVDGIETFPVETEKPIVVELLNRRQVIDLAVSGDVDEGTLKRVGQQVRDDLTAIPGITQVELVTARPYEISIEVSEEALRRHNITFDQIAQAIRRSSLDLPGGSIRSEGGEILLRTKGQAYRGDEFKNIVLLTRPDGTRLLLGQVAVVVDGFAQTDQSARFNGESAVGVRVFRVGDQAALEVARKVKEYVAEVEPRLPAGITVTAWNDFSRVLRSRLDLMLKSARNGYILVLLILAIFLRFRLAFWVSLGIPISFLGALWLMPVLGVSINLISLFAFIVVLGIVVDDAIIVGENIFTHHARSGEENSNESAARGAQEVAMPVIFGVLTTIAAFLPLLNVAGTTGKMMRVIPLVVIAALVFSLVESIMILPAHLSTVSAAGGGKARGPARYWQRFQEWFAGRLERFIDRVYRPSLELGLRYRYATLAWAVATLLLTIGMVGGGWVKFIYFPKVEADFVVAALTLPPGTPAEVTSEAMAQIERAALELKDILGEEVGEEEGNPVQHFLLSVGEQPIRSRQGGHPGGGGGGGLSAGHLGEAVLELTPAEERSVKSMDIARRWRELTGPVPDAVELTFRSSLFSPGAAIDVQLTGHSIEDLREASHRLKTALAGYDGVFDISDTFRPGKQEIKLTIKPAAEAYGLTLADLARQVRQAFYGEEAQRIQRGRDEVRVMIRFPEGERRSMGDLENMRIRTPLGGDVPFAIVAEAEPGRGFASIRRIDRRRAINVTADVDVTKGNAGRILAGLTEKEIPDILADYHGIRYSLEGQTREQGETMGGLIRGFLLALLMIYALMAIPFRSYFQPLIVMAAIPYGVVGAIWGHVIMGLDLTILSMFGLVALTGVVVNDSIVLVHFINQRRKGRGDLLQVVVEAGLSRFRPIVLTSLTTFVGLTPLLLEKSMQAKFLVPMAVSLGFGVVFATFITLVLIPAIYLILEDLIGLIGRFLGAGNLHPSAIEASAGAVSGRTQQ